MILPCCFFQTSWHGDSVVDGVNQYSSWDHPGLVQGWESTASRKKESSIPASSFQAEILIANPGIEICELPAGAKPLACSDGAQALTHTSKRKISEAGQDIHEALNLRIGCSASCAGAIAAYLLTSVQVGTFHWIKRQLRVAPKDIGTYVNSSLKLL